jgi:Na+-transporting methylmalonyl-CoA/oxaloacetate decarboxylase gamma subunit
MASVIAFIKVFAVLVLLVLAVIIIAEFLYKRFFDKTQYIEKENFVSILRQGNVKDVIVVNHSSDRMVAGDGGYYTS